MRRADRLFQIVQLIRGRRLTTAALLAQRLEVSERTVYRDVADLQHQGVPIEGEAGVGYRLGPGFDLPPLMFSEGEAQALVAATRLAQAWLDPELARDAEPALGKILSALPRRTRAAAESLAVYAPASRWTRPSRSSCRRCARRCRQRQQLTLRLPRRGRPGQPAQGAPAGLFLLGQGLDPGRLVRDTQAFRSFRVDRIGALQVTDQLFRPEAGRTLADFLRSVSRNQGA